MTRAYDELLLDRAESMLGNMLDFVTHDLHMDADEFFELFISTGAADDLGLGDAMMILGMSGVELAYAVLDRSGIGAERVRYRYSTGRAGEFRAGRIIARCQHCMYGSFRDIAGAIRIRDIAADYDSRRSELMSSLPWNASREDREEALHRLNEEFEDGYCGIIQRQLGARHDDSAPAPVPSLKMMRLRCRMSQSQLARAADIPVRTLQQYEQGQKDIRKAQTAYIIRLARVLNCEPEDLL